MQSAAWQVKKSEAQCIIDQDYMDPVCMAGISGDQKLTADRVRWFTVKAFSGLLTGSLNVKTLCICRCCHISRTFHRFIKIGTDFIHSDNKHYFFRSLCDAGDTVGISVNVDHDTVVCNGIGAGKKNIRIIGSRFKVQAVFRSFCPCFFGIFSEKSTIM